MAKRKLEKPVERSEYGVDRRTFIIAWESSDTTDEVYEKLAAASRALSLEPMPLPIILARAAGYRRSGLDLKKFKPGRRPDAEDLKSAQELLADIRAKQAPTPKVDKALVDAVVEELIRRLRGTTMSLN